LANSFAGRFGGKPKLSTSPTQGKEGFSNACGATALVHRAKKKIARCAVAKGL